MIVGLRKNPTTLVSREKQTSPSTCSTCGATTVRFGRKAWHCESCGASNEEYQRLNEVLRDSPLSRFLQSSEFRALMEKFEAEFNAKLKAAGLVPVRHEDFWQHLRAFARFDLKLSEEEFWGMTERDFEPFLDRYLRQQTPQSPANPAQTDERRIPEYTSQLKRLVRAGLMTIENKDSNMELRRWMLHNATTQELQAQLKSKAGKQKRVVDVAISEVRTAMGIPAAH